MKGVLDDVDSSAEVARAGNVLQAGQRATMEGCLCVWGALFCLFETECRLMPSIVNHIHMHYAHRLCLCDAGSRDTKSSTSSLTQIHCNKCVCGHVDFK